MSPPVDCFAYFRQVTIKCRIAVKYTTLYFITTKCNLISRWHHIILILMLDKVNIAGINWKRWITMCEYFGIYIFVYFDSKVIKIRSLKQNFLEHAFFPLLTKVGYMYVECNRCKSKIAGFSCSLRCVQSSSNFIGRHWATLVFYS